MPKACSTGQYQGHQRNFLGGPLERLSSLRIPRNFQFPWCLPAVDTSSLSPSNPPRHQHALCTNTAHERVYSSNSQNPSLDDLQCCEDKVVGAQHFTAKFYET